VPLGILDGDGRLIGKATLTGVVRGPFRSADLGYWVSEDSNGRGHGTQAVAAVVRMAFEELGLHRLQAGTLLHNERSQRVLIKNGFTRIGVAPEYLRIAGRWQDHVLFQRICCE
jgi:ribosomal-protein-alanine N-acetyltransferase